MVNKPYIIFNGKNSYTDMGLILSNIDYGTLSLHRAVVSIPYSNEPLSFDYSGIYGVPTYAERKITCTFTIVGESAAMLFAKYSKSCEYFFSSAPYILQLSDYIGYNRKAIVTSISPISRISKNVGKFDVDFACNPYMYSDDLMSVARQQSGNDEYNKDYYNDPNVGTENDTGGRYTIDCIAINDCAPTISHIPAPDKSQYDMEIHTDSGAFCVPAGANKIKLDGLLLKPGHNDIEVYGWGKLKIELYESVI